MFDRGGLFSYYYYYYCYSNSRWCAALTCDLIKSASGPLIFLTFCLNNTISAAVKHSSHVSDGGGGGVIGGSSYTSGNICSAVNATAFNMSICYVLVT